MNESHSYGTSIHLAAITRQIVTDIFFGIVKWHCYGNDEEMIYEILTSFHMKPRVLLNLVSEHMQTFNVTSFVFSSLFLLCIRFVFYFFIFIFALFSSLPLFNPIEESEEMRTYLYFFLQRYL